MESFAIYLIKVNVALIVLYAFYKLFQQGYIFQAETDHVAADMCDFADLSID